MADPITGQTLRWKYDDGPVAGKTFEHRFATDGTVTYGEAGAGAGAGTSGEPAARYAVAKINDDVYAVSYLSRANGYTLTTIIETKARTIVSFASNEKEHFLQHGRLLP